MKLLLLWGWIIIPGYGAMVGPKEVRGPEGSSLSVQCSYEDKYQENKKYWCKDNGIFFSRCVTVISTEAGKEKTDSKMSIKDDPQHLTFTVIMRRVTLKDAGKYQCGISIFGFDEVFAVNVVVLSGLGSPVSPNPSLQPVSTRNVQYRIKVHPRADTPTQEKRKPATFTNVGTRGAILQRGQETLQTRTQQDVAQAVTSHHSSSDMSPRSRFSIPLIRILAPCIIFLLLLVVVIAAILILLARRKRAQLLVETGKNGQFHYSNSVKDSED
ncbi:CMRF35-like molecule 9 isoform X3 [Petaurus breviceps papuanus]|uniref:CMRF35-like molecule 9 isoform X3 n=1 Tax=Petaurus breviceps papuanus TaxID=3040969 RepID=UPI0036DEB465